MIKYKFFIKKVFLGFFLFSSFSVLISTPTFYFEGRLFNGGENILTDPERLLIATDGMEKYIKRHQHETYFKRIINSGKVLPDRITLKDVKKTLVFINETIREDIKKKRKKWRMQDHNFLNKNFRFLKWEGCRESAKKNGVTLPNGKIRLTKYLVYKISGSYKKGGKFKCALYATPKDEDGLSSGKVKKRKKRLTRFKYTKQDVLKGMLDGNSFIEPLVWVTRDGLEEALMQGSAVVVMPDGKERLFNVHKNNEIPYDHSIQPKDQKRYWYFFEKTKDRKKFDDKVECVPEVTCAGNLFDLGLGKVIALKYTNSQTGLNEVRFSALSDTGGAFRNNLHQLDFFSGYFNGRDSFNRYMKSIPSYAEAYILLKK